MKRSARAALLLLATGAFAVTAAHGAALPYREASFASDPGWEGVGNRPGPRSPRCAERTFAFGWDHGTYASTTGEVGGRIAGSGQYRASYAEPLATPATLEDTLTASGTLAVLKSPSSGGILIGWFNSATSYGWRTPDFLGLRVVGNPGSSYGVGAEYGTSNVMAGTANPGAKLKPKKRYAWTLTYTPSGGEFASGLLHMTIGSYSAERAIVPQHRLDGASFDRFGLLNVQYDGPAATIYTGDLLVGGQPVDLSHDPGWEGIDNTLSGVTDCRVTGRQDFGYSPTTSFAGGDPGEIGGLVWRVGRSPAWYGDPISDVTLGDTLYAEGRIVLQEAWTDSDLLLGWFNSGSRTPSRGRFPTSVMAADIGAASKWGYRFFPVFAASKLTTAVFDDDQHAPRLTPPGTALRFWICYTPSADALGDGQLTVGLQDAAELEPPSVATLAVSPAAKGLGATFNRFGIRSVDVGGLSADVFLDDLRYTSGPGDAGPPDRCGGA